MRPGESVKTVHSSHVPDTKPAQMSTLLTTNLKQPMTKYQSELLDKHEQWCVHRWDICPLHAAKL